MTDAEKREAARQFYNKWVNKGKEDEDDRSYWIDFLQEVMGIDHVTDRIEFQKKVVGPDGNTKRIDAYIPETKVLIEQKSLNIDLTKPQAGHNGMTPYEQAKMYDNSLPHSEKAKWIIISNFAEIWVYDMDARVPQAEKFTLADIPTKFSKFEFLVNQEQQQISQEVEVSVKAGELVGLIYDALLKQYINPKSEDSLKSLNMLCVRLVFCLYAEDAHIFGDGDHMFHNYLNQFETKDMRKALIELFKTLDTKTENRDPYDTSDLSKFPYVNGGLFADENIEIPNFTDEIRTVLLSKASDGFDWSMISPTIFGAVFESTLNPETRRRGGMHYTSIENIHKVIDPLFLDDLKAEFDEIKGIQIEKTRNTKLKAFQNKLASLTWLDPACGSGNFLTETYISIRRLENEIISTLKGGQMMILMENNSPIKVSIDQFYGIEINDFAVTVAKTALWIAESQMLKETEAILLMHIDFLPLKTNAYIHEGNALEVEWEDIIHNYNLSFIMGNPPFIGSSIKEAAEQQKKDKEKVFGDKKSGKLDYVACWYKKAADYIKGTRIKVAFVSTNSITQGEQVRPLWEELLNSGIEINFAYRTFQWDSEAHIKAHVHCVIICMSNNNSSPKFIIENGVKKSAEHINGYLVNAPDFYITSRGKAPEGLPKLTQGNKPWDDGGLILSEEERNELVLKYPQLDKYIRLYLGSRDFINNVKRYCLWLIDAEPSDYRNIPEIKKRLQKVVDIRLASPTKQVQKQAKTPTIFSQIRQPNSDYIMIPETSSSSRRYIPMGFMSRDVIASNSCMTATDATLYMFGILESNVHMAWVRTLCGRMKSDYRYSPALYNNFPWPSVSEKQKKQIELTAQGILDARAKFEKSTLADLYDPNYMPKVLVDAHIANDRAVMKAYGFSIKDMSEADCVAALMKMYQERNSEK